jgi:hypothetical protein
VDGGRADAEVPLKVGCSGGPAEHAIISIDEGQILTLLGREGWNRGERHIGNLIYTGVTRGKRLVVLAGQRKALTGWPSGTTTSSAPRPSACFRTNNT